MQRVDFYAVDAEGNEAISYSWVERDGQVVDLESGDPITEPYAGRDGEVKDPQTDPDEYLEHLHEEYSGSTLWASYAYEDNTA